jgi:hypothetical protein
MKRYSLLLFMTLSIFHLQAQENAVLMFSYFKGNGEDGLHLAFSKDGYAWRALKNDSSFLKPVVGESKLMRDPCIIKGPDNLYHMVWTSGWTEKGIGYANSKDLIHWSSQQYIAVMEDEPNARNCWAPEIFYDEEKDRYMIYWASTIKGKFEETQSSKEKAYNHRIYYVSTKDFKTFSTTGLLYDQGFNVIDATILPYNDHYVMFLKDETVEPPQKNLRTATSSYLTHGYTKPSDPITGSYWAEGPTVTRIGNQWVVYFDKYTEKKMGAVVSEDLKTWTDISDKISFPEGLRHGTVFKVSQSEFEKLEKE